MPVGLGPYMSGWRLFIAAVFWVSQNRYYGWHWMPQSDGELIADGIVMLLLALAIAPSESSQRTVE